MPARACVRASERQMRRRGSACCLSEFPRARHGSDRSRAPRACTPAPFPVVAPPRATQFFCKSPPRLSTAHFAANTPVTPRDRPLGQAGVKGLLLRDDDGNLGGIGRGIAHRVASHRVARRECGWEVGASRLGAARSVRCWALGRESSRGFTRRPGAGIVAGKRIGVRLRARRDARGACVESVGWIARSGR